MTRRHRHHHDSVAGRVDPAETTDMTDDTTYPSADPAWMLDLMVEPVNRYRIADRVITYCNAAWAALYGVDASVAVGSCLDGFLSADEMAGLHGQLAALGPHNRSLVDEAARAIRGTTERWLEWVDHYVVTDTGPEVLSVGRDVTDRHVAEGRLAESEARFRGLADNTADVLWRTRLAPRIGFEYVNPSVERILGYPASWFVEDFRRLVDIAEPDTKAVIEMFLEGGRTPDRLDLTFRHAAGHVVIGETSITVDAHGAQGVMRDVTELRHLQAALATLATTDPLTALANRRRFNDVLAAQLALPGRPDIAVVDDLKSINDRFGHDAGDVVLQEAARRIASMIDGPDIAARLGGDEFAIVHHATGGSTRRLVRTLDALLRAPIAISPSRTVKCTASIGAAESADVGRIPANIVAAADQAMYLVKRQGVAYGERSSPCATD